jgi:hypothetical protein
MFLQIATQGYHAGRVARHWISGLDSRIEAMLALRLYEKIRLFQPMGCLFQPGATTNLPPGATAEMPSCLLCGTRSSLPPAKVDWIAAGDEQRLFLVCGDCGT